MIAKKILIISDDPPVSLGIRYFLTSKDYSVDVIENSSEGVVYCYNHSPDLVIIQYSSLGIPPDALTVCRTLRQDSRSRQLPLFIISASHEKALQAGATEWFDIVFDITILENKISAYLS